MPAESQLPPGPVVASRVSDVPPSPVTAGVSARTGADASGPEHLMLQYQLGKNDAFDSLYVDVAPRIRNYLRRYTTDSALIEDVIQITFAKVYRARHSYRPGSPVLPWVMVIARRTLLDERRGLAAKSEVLSDHGRLPDPPLRSRSDQVADMHMALNALPEQYRSAIELTKLVGLSGAEAATLLRTTQSAVKLRVHRGYELLRRMFDVHGAGAAA